MYESFYGFKEKPFELHPDPDFLYMSEGHEDAYVHLEYSIDEGKGFVIVTGEIGAGKTTLVNRLLQKIPQNVEIGVINNTALPPGQFLKMLCQEFELNVNGLDRPELLDSFNEYLLEQYAAQHRVVLIVDEAQNLPAKTLEEIRLLSNLETEKHHLLQIILVGQPELRLRLRKKGLEQFLQRVTVHCHLGNLSPGDVKNYVRHRLRIAGASRLDIFDDAALDAVAEHSRGIPRLINLLCDTALLNGFAEEVQSLGRGEIEEVVEARAAGGLLTDASAEGIEEEAEPLIQPDALGEIEERITRIEERTRSMNLTLGQINEQLSALSRTDDHIIDALDAVVTHTRRQLEEMWQQIQSLPEMNLGPAILPPAEPENTVDEQPKRRSSVLSRRRKRR